MGFFIKRKIPLADASTKMDEPIKAELDSTSPTDKKGPDAMSSTDTPPPQYSAADSSSPKFVADEISPTTDSGTNTLQSTTSAATASTAGTVYSPDEFKGATRQPTVSGGNVIIARHQAPPVDDGSLPEVVTHGTGDSNITTTSTHSSHFMASHSRLSLPPTPGLEVVDDATVTPLHLLGDQSDTVDCPFCRRRVETRVQKDPSAATHAQAAGLFLVSLGGVVVPYKRQWRHHVTHFCGNCSRKVAVQRNGQATMQPLGTPEHLRQASRFTPAVPKPEAVASTTTLS